MIEIKKIDNSFDSSPKPPFFVDCLPTTLDGDIL